MPNDFMQPAITVIINLIAIISIYSWLAFALARLHWSGRGVPMVIATIYVAGSAWIVPILFWLALGKVAPPTYAVWFGNWLVSGFAIILLVRKTSRIPREFADSARVDGCGAWGIYWHVAVPLALRDLALLAMLILMATAPQFLIDRVPLLRSDVVARAGIASMAVGSLLMTTPLLLIFFVTRRDSQSSGFGRVRERF